MSSNGPYTPILDARKKYTIAELLRMKNDFQASNDLPSIPDEIRKTHPQSKQSKPS